MGKVLRGEMHPGGMERLREAIIKYAVNDIVTKNGKTKDSREAVAFFKSDYGKTITGVEDSDLIIKVLRKRHKYYEFRNALKCFRCTYRGCIHNKINGGDYTSIDRGEMYCPKNEEKGMKP